MFEAVLKQEPQPSETVCWIPAMPGVAVCDFDAAFAAMHHPHLEPGHYETLFCQGGALYIHTKSEQGCCIRKGDVLLVSDTSQIETISFSGGRFRGTVVIVNAAKATGSLAQIRSLLGGMELEVRQVGQLMRACGGCACIHGELWSEALFIALAGLQAEERGRYCTLKAVELLYLLCRGGFDLSRTWMEHCNDRCQMDLTRQINDYIQSHLAEDLTINSLSKKFHCSPTALKTSFRRSYGIPIHRCIAVCRLRRGAELLDTTALPIAQIASEVGYNSVSQFSAMFRRRYQISPAQYRSRSEKSETGHFSV